MLDFVALPTEEFLVINGASRGAAGTDMVWFGRASHDAWIFDPKEADNALKFKIPAGTSPIARVYHSVALLLPNATVWVAGSSPGGGGRVQYRTEFRSEIYTPYYLVGNPVRPEFYSVGVDLGWNARTEIQYGQVLTLRIKRKASTADTSKLRIMVVNSGFTTHAQNNHQRLVVLEYELLHGGLCPDEECTSDSCLQDQLATQTSCYQEFTATTPPRAALAPPGWYLLFVVEDKVPSEGQWMQLGGDPANFKDFLPSSPEMENPVFAGGFEVKGETGVVAVHAALLPNGNVFVQGGGEGGAKGNLNEKLRAAEYDPTTESAQVYENQVSTNAFGTGFVDFEGKCIAFGGRGEEGSGIRVWNSTSTPGAPSPSSAVVQQSSLSGLSGSRHMAGSAILGDGRVVIIQGAKEYPPATVSNNLEIFPVPEGCPSSNCLVPVSLLADCEKRNGVSAYPYSTVLPDGSLFLLCGQLSAVLDTATNAFAEKIRLPMLLDSPDQSEADAPSRTHPSSASIVLLPVGFNDQTGEDLPAKILVCGGSVADSGSGSETLSSCGTIEPSSPNPKWDYIDTMPSGRANADFVLLPDQSVLMINGISTGSAGAGNALAENAVLDVWIYDTRRVRPRSRDWYRFNKAGASAIPRPYRGTALLLPDATVWVSGGMPEDSPAGARYEAEVYTPHYLQNTRGRPILESFPGAPTPGFASKRVFDYNTEFTVAVLLGKPEIYNVVWHKYLRFVLIKGGYATHGTNSNQRAVVLRPVNTGAWTIAGNNRAKRVTAAVLAPKNGDLAPNGWYMLFVVEYGVPSVAEWVLIGGEPEKINDSFVVATTEPPPPPTTEVEKETTAPPPPRPTTEVEKETAARYIDQDILKSPVVDVNDGTTGATNNRIDRVNGETDTTSSQADRSAWIMPALITSFLMIFLE
ncbi:MAG: hypothetical protein SGCHY_002215 [Lobulomycetales sp.]